MSSSTLLPLNEAVFKFFKASFTELQKEKAGSRV